MLQLTHTKVAQAKPGYFGLESAIDFDTLSGTNARRSSENQVSIKYTY